MNIQTSKRPDYSSEFELWWTENGYFPIVPAPVYEALKDNCKDAYIAGATLMSDKLDQANKRIGELEKVYDITNASWKDLQAENQKLKESNKELHKVLLKSDVYVATEKDWIAKVEEYTKLEVKYYDLQQRLDKAVSVIEKIKVEMPTAYQDYDGVCQATEHLCQEFLEANPLNTSQVESKEPKEKVLSYIKCDSCGNINCNKIDYVVNCRGYQPKLESVNTHEIQARSCDNCGVKLLLGKVKDCYGCEKMSLWTPIENKEVEK